MEEQENIEIECDDTIRIENLNVQMMNESIKKANICGTKRIAENSHFTKHKVIDEKNSVKECNQRKIQVSDIGNFAKMGINATDIIKAEKQIASLTQEKGER